MTQSHGMPRGSGRVVRVAMAQLLCTDVDLDMNLGRIASLVARAAAEAADIVLFPETCDFGWVNPEAHRRAGSVPGAFSDQVAERARAHSLWIGIGLCEKDGDRLYDSAVLIDPGGRIVLKHRKINLLSWLMEPPYTAGAVEDIATAPTPFGSMGMLICADSFDARLCAALAARRPDLVYIPYGWAECPEAWPEHGFELVKTVQRAAHAMQAPVFGPNVVGRIAHGPWRGRTFEGLSTAADARGLSLVQGPWNREALVLCDIELGT